MARADRARRVAARGTEEVLQGRAARARQLAELKRLAADLDRAQADLAHADHERNALLARIPNLPDPTAADGMAEEDSQVLREVGERPSFGFTPRDATELGSKRGWIDMKRGARLSGSRFAYRIGDVAMTELALYRFVLDKLAGPGLPAGAAAGARGEQASTAPGSCPPRSPTSTTWKRTTCT